MHAAAISDEDIARWRRWRGERFANWVGVLKSGINLPPPLDISGYEDIIAACRAGRSIEPWDGDMPQADSGDSYNSFVFRSRLREGRPWTEKQWARHEARVAAQQAAWEAKRLRRQQEKEAEAQRQWEAEEARRKAEAEMAALRKAEAEEARRQWSRQWAERQEAAVLRQADLALAHMLWTSYGIRSPGLLDP